MLYEPLSQPNERKKTYENIYYDKTPTVWNGLHKCGKGNGFTIDSFWTKFDVWTVNACMCLFLCPCVCGNACIHTYVLLYLIFLFQFVAHFLCVSLSFAVSVLVTLSIFPTLFQSPIGILWIYLCVCFFYFVLHFHFNVTISQFCGYVYMVSVHVWVSQ